MPQSAQLVAQPQEAPLAADALHSLDDLRRLNSSTTQKLQSRLAKAIELITEVSTQVNDRGLEERVRYTRKRSKLLANGQDEDIEEQQEHQQYQTRVDDLTKKMDYSIRGIIDDQVWLENVPDAIAHVITKAGTVSDRSRSTQTTTQRTQNDIDLDELPEQDDNRPLIQPDPREAPMALLDAAFSTKQTMWQSKSLTDRYSEHNDYVGWYRMVYDAQHPGENPPPMPHASMWFAEEENRTAATNARGSQSDRQQRSTSNGIGTGDDPMQSDAESDIEIAAEKIRIKCPITLLPFKDPLASTKCPHAFEKAAILDMFKHTNEHLPLTTEEQNELSQISRPQERSKRERQLKTPMIRCPECSVPLSGKDLRPDPVLLRRVNRILERERRREEAEQRDEDDIMDADDDDGGDGLPRGTQRRKIVHLGSSPPRSVRRLSGRVIKGERQSIPPPAEIDSDDE